MSPITQIAPVVALQAMPPCLLEFRLGLDALDMLIPGRLQAIRHGHGLNHINWFSRDGCLDKASAKGRHDNIASDDPFPDSPILENIKAVGGFSDGLL